jgi:hypothetical protein
MFSKTELTTILGALKRAERTNKFYSNLYGELIDKVEIMVNGHNQSEDFNFKLESYMFKENMPNGIDK